MSKKKYLLMGALLVVAVSTAIAGSAYQRTANSLIVGDGTSATKSVTFDTGNGSNNPHVQGLVSNNSVKVSEPLVLDGDGTGSTPSLQWASESNTGIYHASSGNISFVTAGTVTASLTSSGLGLGGGNITAGTATLSGGTLSGTFSGSPTFSGTPTLSGPILGGGGSGPATQVLKAAFFSGTVANSSTHSVIVSGATQIYGATGVFDLGGGSVPITYTLAGGACTSGNVCFSESAAGTDNITISNNFGAGTLTFHVVVFYQ